MMLYVKTFCCDCRLENGARIIGWYSLISSMLGTLYLRIRIQMISERLQGFESLHNGEKDFPEPSDTNSMLSFDYRAAITFFILFAIETIVSILLLGGQRTKRSGLLIPWLIYYVTLAVLEALLHLARFFNSMDSHQGIEGIKDIFYLALIFGIKAHFILVVYSHRAELNSNRVPAKFEERY